MGQVHGLTVACARDFPQLDRIRRGVADTVRVIGRELRVIGTVDQEDRTRRDSRHCFFGRDFVTGYSEQVAANPQCFRQDYPTDHRPKGKAQSLFHGAVKPGERRVGHYRSDARLSRCEQERDGGSHALTQEGDRGVPKPDPCSDPVQHRFEVQRLAISERRHRAAAPAVCPEVEQDARESGLMQEVEVGQHGRAVAGVTVAKNDDSAKGRLSWGWDIPAGKEHAVLCPKSNVLEGKPERGSRVLAVKLARRMEEHPGQPGGNRGGRGSHDSMPQPVLGTARPGSGVRGIGQYRFAHTFRLPAGQNRRTDWGRSLGKLVL